VIEWNVPDPYGREIEFYRSVREVIARQVAALLEDLGKAAQDANRE
jgi:protein-tyrosine-phosphatase